VKLAAKTKRKTHQCGFCQTGHHDLCPESIKGAAGGPETTWYCSCATADHDPDKIEVEFEPEE
jgi:hypothetical protein